MTDPTKNRVLITRTDAGLGLSLVKRFLRGGYRVFAGVYKSIRELHPLTEEYPDELRLLPLNVADMDSICQAALRVSDLTNALDIVINNAGIHLDDSKGALEQLDLAGKQLQQTMEVNAFGPLRVVQQFLPFLENGGQKLIVNISSEAGSIANCGREDQFAYCMSKAALNMQSKILQNYLRPRGFKVLVIHPGWMRTKMGGPQALLHADKSAEAIFRLTGKEWSADDPMYVDYEGQPLPW